MIFYVLGHLWIALVIIISKIEIPYFMAKYPKLSIYIEYGVII